MTTSLVPFTTRFGLIDDFRKEMDNLFSRFFENGNEPATPLANWTPRLNLCETDEEYRLTVDLPGVDPKDVNIELRHGDLWITGQRESESEESGQTWHRMERYCGQFRRVIRLGDDVDSDHINAEYKNGVLHISVPKTEQAKTRKITIKS